jgi:hypothetical protein
MLWMAAVVAEMKATEKSIPASVATAVTITSGREDATTSDGMMVETNDAPQRKA